VVSKAISEDSTHLITTETDFNKPSQKVKQAQSKGIHIVTLTWIEDCLKEQARVSEDDYTLGAPAAVSKPAATVPDTSSKSNGSRKRTVPVVASDDEEDVKPTKKTKPAASKNSQSRSQIASRPAPKAEVQSSSKPGDGETNIATSRDLNIAVDETCPLIHYRVYIDADGLIYDAALNQTNAGHNANKFYRVQVGNYTTIVESI
jgi:poly [ADP-ribose] polymerase